MKTQYWSCTKLADRIRGTAKPEALGWNEWDLWNKQAKEKHPVRYWIADTFLDRLQDTVMFIPNSIYNVKYWITNRFVTKTHQLTAHPRDIKPGTWCDYGDRILPCLFNELCNYVEVELAWKNIAWDLEARTKYKAPGRAWGRWRWRTWRSAPAGLDYLSWEMSLVYDKDSGIDESDPLWMTPTQQAVQAQEVRDLYTWWTKARPQRKDPHELSGWSQWCETREGRGFATSKLTQSEREYVDQMLEHVTKLEQEYDQEDTNKLIQLIKLRKVLWT